MDLGEQHILITGASSGIGRETARMLASRGAALELCDRDVEGGQALAAELDREGTRARFHALDVSDEDAVQAVFEGLDRPLTAAVNCAGIDHKLVRTDEVPVEDFDRIMSVNVRGLWLCMRAELRHMKASGGGHIINIASVAGLKSAPLMGVYSASKFAVVGLTKTAAVEYARFNIRVNAVCPAIIRTPMVERHGDEPGSLMERFVSVNPMRRLGEPEEVASIIAWLCSPESSFVNGEAIAVDGGLTA